MSGNIDTLPHLKCTSALLRRKMKRLGFHEACKFLYKPIEKYSESEFLECYHMKTQIRWIGKQICIHGTFDGSACYSRFLSQCQQGQRHGLRRGSRIFKLRIVGQTVISPIVNCLPSSSNEGGPRKFSLFEFEDLSPFRSVFRSVWIYLYGPTNASEKQKRWIYTVQSGKWRSKWIAEALQTRWQINLFLLCSLAFARRKENYCIEQSLLLL